jgi:spore coat protein U-like protein
VTYRCNGAQTLVWISLTRGQSNTFEARTMTRGAERLEYNLYRDAARTAVWGDGSSGTQVAFDLIVPKNSDVTLPIYARIPAGQDVRAGTYSDTVSLVVNY